LARAPLPIVFCITDLDRGGAEQALVQIVTRLDRREWSPHVICLTGEGELAVELREAGVPVTCLHAKRWWNLGVLFRLKRELRRLRPAVLQTFLYHANILGRVAGRMARVPVIVSGIRVAERRSRFRLWLDRATDRWVSRHVCVSEGVAKFSTETGGLANEKIVVIPNGVEFERFAGALPADLSVLGLGPEHRVVLFVGRLDPQKGISILLDAMRELSRDSRFEGTHLLLAGEGPLRGEIEVFARENRLEDRVHLLGRRNDVPALMKAADCLVLPSLWEGMPNVVLEAMAAGLPVVATAVEGTSELVQCGETGLLVPAGDVRGLLAGIVQVLSDAEFAQGIARSAQVTVRKRFAWEAVAGAYGSLYRELIG
jgi:glycosyltransferase involved in cell wall biosynthesis